VSHHANDGSASRARRALVKEHGYTTHDAAAAAITAAQVQAVRCARGEHDETVAKQGYVTYVRGSQVQPGTRYCRFCSAILRRPEEKEQAVSYSMCAQCGGVVELPATTCAPCLADRPAVR